MEEKSLQATVDKFYKKIPASARLATGATFLMGILVNLFVFTNKSVNHDDIMAEFIFNKQLDIVFLEEVKVEIFLKIFVCRLEPAHLKI